MKKRGMGTISDKEREAYEYIDEPSETKGMTSDYEASLMKKKIIQELSKRGRKYKNASYL